MIARVAAGAIAAPLLVAYVMRSEQPHNRLLLPPGCPDTTKLSTSLSVGDLDAAGSVRLDPSRPVASKNEIVSAWRKRQDSIRSFQFEWTEVQCHPRGWIPNPRYAEREWLSIPGLRIDRSYTVRKTLAVSGNMMRYTFELDRAEEPDGVLLVSPTGANDGLGVRGHYTYESVFDGRTGATRLRSHLSTPPPSAIPSRWNVDAQNLDTRAILLTFRPLDRDMGLLLIDRAVTNQRRMFYKGRSTQLLEERHDPSHWKTILWVEPERDFLISRFGVNFSQRRIVDIDIDYRRDARWGWIPSGWRVTEMLADGSRRVISLATVTSYRINAVIPPEQFR